MLRQLRERRRRAIADAKKREAAKKKPSSVERRAIRAEPKVAVAPKRGTTVKARPPTRTVGRKEPPISIPKAPPKKKEPTRGRVIASRTEKEDAAKKARAERAAREAAERKAKEAAAKKAREQAAKEAKAEKEREARIRAENQRKEEQRKKERLAAVKRERELKAARAAAAAKKAAEEKAAKEAAEAKAARAAEAKRVAEEKKAAANRRAIAQREEKKAAQERARAAKEAAEAERLREEARRAAALRDAKNARTPARGPAVEKEPKIPMTTMPPPEDIVSRGTVGPVAPRPPAPQRDSEPVIPPIQVTPPPDDVVSRGTVGPVAPKPPTTPKTPVKDPEPEPKIPQISFGPTYDPDPELNKLYSQLSMTIGQGGGIRPLTEEEAKAGSARIKELEKKIIDAGGQPYKYFTRLPHGYFGDKDPGPGYDPMTGTYKKDERPEEPKSPFAPGYPYNEGPRDGPTPPLSEPTPPTGPSPGDMLIPGGGIDTTSGPGADPKKYKELMGEGKKKEPKAPSEPTPPPIYRTHEFIDNNMNGIDDRDEAEDLMPVRPMPRFIDMDPLKGVRETFVPRNILGQSYDPKVREEYEKDVDRKRPDFYARLPGMGYANPSYRTPTMAVPQVQFGGYGQPMPMAPLAPYAGLAGSPGMYMVEEEEEEEVRPGGPSRPPGGGVS